jgi:hypothetical protein
VPRSLAIAPPEAVGVPVVVTGGHAPAHAPVQVEVSPVSLTHRYTARPEPSVRNVPADDDAVVMTVAPDAPVLAPAAPLLLAGGAAAGELLAAAVLLALLHAATSSTAPTAPPTPAASLAGADTRFNMEFLILFVSCLARPPALVPLPEGLSI